MKEMKISLFSQSLFALTLVEAIETTARTGFPAMELACAKPHFDMETALRDANGVAERIRKAGLKVSALSLFNNFTDGARLADQVEDAKVYIRLAPLFNTEVIKMTPGPPGSAEATEEHWRCLGVALEQLAPVAEEVGVRLAFETHMRQLTDTLAGAKRLLEMAKTDVEHAASLLKVVGLTVDFSNLAFAGEDMRKAVSVLAEHTYNTHLKNGLVGEDGSWQFNALDDGLTDYLAVLSLLRDVDYKGYFTIECLGTDASERPAETAKRDLIILRRYLERVGY
jgi:sugar phosphate isomerase/epimerase